VELAEDLFGGSEFVGTGLIGDKVVEGDAFASRCIRGCAWLCVLDDGKVDELHVAWCIGYRFEVEFVEGGKGFLFKLASKVGL
jgi:hypothetical protein